MLASVARASGCAVDEAPLADGGEGTLDVLAKPLGLSVETYDVEGMLGARVTPRLGLAKGRALVEAAEAVGLPLVAPHARDPLRATTRGLGQLLSHAVDRGATEIFVALGGSATIDGGAGLRETFPAGRSLSGVKLVGLVDVDVPLAGARLFMKQKFARGAAVDDAVLDALTAKLLAMYPPQVAAVAGAGAAGGLGAALVSLGATLVSGAAFTIDALKLDERIARADAVFTGEGRIDEQTLHGKLIGALARSCAKHQKPLVAFCGAADVTLDGVDVVVITPPGEPLERALANAADNLAKAARAALARLQPSA